MSFEFLHGANLVSTLLDTNGDGSGNTNANGNYDGNATLFYIQPPVEVVYKIFTVNLEMVVAGSFEADGYGDGLQLENGIAMLIENDGSTSNLLSTGGTIKANSSWSLLSSPERIGIVIPKGNSLEHLLSRIVLTEMYNTPIYLNGATNDKFGFLISDDMSTRLLSQTWLTTGRIRLDIEKGGYV